EWCWRRFRGWIMQDRVLVDAAIHGARLDSNDKRHRDSIERCGHRHVRYQRRCERKRYQRRAAGWQVEVRYPRRRRAIDIGWRPQRCSVRQPEILRLTDEGLQIRSGNDRPLDRVVRYDEASSPGSQRVLTQI